LQLLIVGDTHVPTRSRNVPDIIWQEVRKADIVIHTGDFVTVEVLEQFDDEAKELRAVHGNQDTRALRENLPSKLSFELEGVQFVVTHGHAWGRPRPSRIAKEFHGEADYVIYGHLHRSFLLTFGSCTVINPGSPVDPRSGKPSYVLATVSNGELHAEIQELAESKQV
jgi:hypothetical protein